MENKMENNNRFYCDLCKEEQELKKPKVEEVEHKKEGKVERHYIECQKCGAKFTSFYKNSKVAELIEKQEALHQKLKEVHIELNGLRVEVTKECKRLQRVIERKKK